MTSTVQESNTAHLVELVYPGPLSEVVDRIVVDGVNVELELRAERRGGAAELAAVFRHPDMRGLVVRGDAVVVTMASEASARSINLDQHLLDNGPFKVAESVSGRLRLERRDDRAGIECIEVIDHASSDIEWRRLMASEIDMLPFASAAAVTRLVEVPSLRAVAFAEPSTIGLWFGLKQGAAVDWHVRRAISLTLRRGALAMMITGDRSFAEDVEEDLEEARRLLADVRKNSAPLSISIYVAAVEHELQRAALVVQQQLAAVGIDLRIELVPVEELGRRMLEGGFEIVIHYVGWRPDHWHYLRTGSPTNLLGYSSPEFDAWAAAGDEPSVRRILSRDVPVTPLYRRAQGVVVSRAFCNVHPVVSHDLTWLKDVRLCAPGEVD